jgi:hypothetical protein
MLALPESPFGLRKRNAPGEDPVTLLTSTKSLKFCGIEVKDIELLEAASVTLLM